MYNSNALVLRLKLALLSEYNFVLMCTERLYSEYCIIFVLEIRVELIQKQKQTQQ